MNRKKDKKKLPENFNFIRSATLWLLLFFALIWLVNMFSTELNVKELEYGNFYKIAEKNSVDKRIKSVKKIGNVLKGEFTPEGAKTVGDNKTYFQVNIPAEDKDVVGMLRGNVEKFSVEPPKDYGLFFYYVVLPTLFLVFFWYFSFRGNQAGSRVWSFGRSRAQIIEKEKATRITFKDVAGIDEAKEELNEVIDFLSDPKKFQKLGGRIPKGVLLVGPPGCGKTLLAKAVAGEAEVPFFSISGSDFVEMFVGVGASRVRDLFEQAKRASKSSGKGCIVFIDEIDAVGRQRFAGIGGGHDEREQTLNQLLVEMDGFHSDEAVIVMAATNRPDVLDPALLRPGRFDRHIVIYPPDIKGREDILKVHTRKLKLAKEIDLQEIAKQTPGFSGADLANLCNEGALLAARHNKESVEQVDLVASIERVMMGPEKKSRVMSKHEKELTAYHESGHALLSLLIPEVNPMTKVSIIPRGIAGGYTFAPPKEDRHYKSKKELYGEIVVALGGRAAEEVIFVDVTTGAMRDLEEVTSLARKIVCDYGMSDKIGNRALGRSHGPIFLGRDMVEEKDYSEDTAKVVDEEVKRIVDESYVRARKLIVNNLDKLKLLANALLEKEVLDAVEAEKLLGLQKEKLDESTDNTSPDS